MNWILEHLQIVIAIAGAFAYWLIQRKELEPMQPPVMVARAESQEAILGRQERLAEQLRALEERKVITQRRAAELVEVNREADGVRERAASYNVRQDLREARTLRH